MVSITANLNTGEATSGPGSGLATASLWFNFEGEDPQNAPPSGLHSLRGKGVSIYSRVKKSQQLIHEIVMC